MKNNKIRIRTWFIILLPLGILLSYFASLNSKVVENVYSNGIDMPIRQSLSNIFGILPFSAAEAIIILLISYCIYLIIKTIVIFIRTARIERKKTVINFFKNLISAVSIIYFTFILVWGLNYYRLPFSKIAKYDVKPASAIELGNLCNSLIDRANTLRMKVPENKNGIMFINGGRKSVFERAPRGYIIASVLYPELKGRYGRPKGVIFSTAMSYAGISGVYFPFTGEPNVNIDIPDSMLPSTTCHEMAHQRGFAREDEANYIAYLVCNKSPYYDFQYSGTLLGLIYSMDSLYTYDNKRWKALILKYSSGLRRDLTGLNAFWDKYEGPVERVSNSINNAYLKVNMQKSGVFSYGRMVDLLLAEYRAKKQGA